MKQAILTILARLTNAMKADSRAFHTSFLPIIQSAIEPGSETQVYLLEDALDLWSSILAQTPSAPESTPPELLNLLQYLLPLFSMDNDTLRKAIELTEAYLLLAPAAVLADNFRPGLLGALAELLGSLKPEASGKVSNLMQTIIRGADGLGGEEATKVVVADLISSGFLAKLMEGLHAAWGFHQSHGPYQEKPDRAVDGVVETDYFSVFARIGLASPNILLEALSSVGGADLEKTLSWLLEEWFGHIENIGDPPNKKMMTLVLTRLLETGAPWILGRLQNLIVVWTDVLGELLDGMDDKSAEYVHTILPVSQLLITLQLSLLDRRTGATRAQRARSPGRCSQARAHLLRPCPPHQPRLLCARALAAGYSERWWRTAIPGGVAESGG